MLDHPIIDIALGLVLFYVVLSLVASAVQEWIASLLALRSKNLHEGIRNLVGSESARLLYRHPLVKNLAKENKLPSYIAPETMSTVLLEVLAKENAGQSCVACTAGQVREMVGKIPAEHPLKEVLEAFVDTNDDAAAGLQNRLADWLDEGMTRVSGWYKRRVKIIIIAIAAVVTIVTNASTIHVAEELWRNDALRVSIAVQAQSAAKQQDARVLSPGAYESAALISHRLERRAGRPCRLAQARDGLGDHHRRHQPRRALLVRPARQGRQSSRFRRKDGQTLAARHIVAFSLPTAGEPHPGVWYSDPRGYWNKVRDLARTLLDADGALGDDALALFGTMNLSTEASGSASDANLSAPFARWVLATIRDGLRPRVLVLLGLRTLIGTSHRLSALFEEAFEGLDARRPHREHPFQVYRNRRLVFREWNLITPRGAPLLLVDWPQHPNRSPFTSAPLWRALVQGVRRQAQIAHQVMQDTARHHPVSELHQSGAACAPKQSLLRRFTRYPGWAFGLGYFECGRDTWSIAIFRRLRSNLSCWNFRNYAILMVMNRQRTPRLKPLLDRVPPGFMVDTPWLRRQGIDPKSIHDYVARGWLKRGHPRGVPPSIAGGRKGRRRDVLGNLPSLVAMDHEVRRSSGRRERSRHGRLRALPEPWREVRASSSTARCHPG